MILFHQIEYQTLSLSYILEYHIFGYMKMYVR
jgi:hypothetical protein